MPPAELPSVDELVREIVGDAGLEGGLDQGGAHVDVAGHMEELLARRSLELAPELVRPLKEGDVADALGVGEPDDARDAVRRAHRVRNVEALEPEDALPAPGEVEAGRAPHRSDPGDDRVVVTFGHFLTLRGSREAAGESRRLSRDSYRATGESRLRSQRPTTTESREQRDGVGAAQRRANRAAFRAIRMEQPAKPVAFTRAYAARQSAQEPRRSTSWPSSS